MFGFGLSYVLQMIVLKVRLHCKACEKAVRKALWKIKGVKCVEMDVITSKITVLGYVDSKVVIKAIRKTGRRAEVWPSSSRRADSVRSEPNVATWVYQF
ncbi:PREDICTED: heavy metal-associated isoprenylated plant protein 20-like [Nelumbo nucifera]|uniref:Heavy metal-associated isoprenylated plant protein 20-like n=2 Tax=Nelumbo nucifera TaxID=4432 RepID=A0A1U8BMB1_NELNU|nr:PREDICTED: heavy metal-associated isoprenylated plant protein 20-like [Nelumbo nucifera]DAD46331.1 TPA_asm: hypothetical protein HUJ06_004561 [Nelumbo nucifera]